MASLVMCKVCKKEHSDDVNRCPSCGAKYSKPLTKRPFALLMLAVFGVLVVSAVMGSLGGRDASPVQTTQPAAPTPPVSTAELTARFSTERADLAQRLNASLKTKDRYSVLFVADEFKAVADPEFLALLQRVHEDEAKTASKLQERLAADEKKEARKKGVNVGMTREQVKASSWGKPQSVNTTTSAYGNREQWVYGRSYLYFENGVLTTIQN